MSVLDEIVETKWAEVDALRGRLAELDDAVAAAPPVRDFVGALDGSTVSVIAEFKRRSPSKGELAPDLDPVVTARAYEAGGAACLSILTDAPYFGGAPADLVGARSATGLPVLRKDFTVDPLQVDEARAMGADAVLLIVAVLSDGALRDLHDHATARGITAVVEVHDEAELDRALAVSPRVLGINARDLSNFSEDLSTGERMVARIPSGTIAVAESAIRSVADARRMADAGFDAVLVGEALVRAPDPTALVRAFAELPVALSRRSAS